MSHRQNVEQNLQRFADGIGLGELKLNEFGACGLCFDDTMVVNIEYLEADEALVFVASITKVTDYSGTREELLEKMLFFNLQHHSMQGAFTSLNNDKSEILIARSIQASTDYGYFESCLEKFVNSFEWILAEVNNEGGAHIPNQNAVNSERNQSQNKKTKPPPTDMGMMV